MSYTKTAGLTINFDDWLETRKQSIEPIDDLSTWRRDFDGLRYLDHKCNFSGFMTGPIATWKGEQVAAFTRHIDSIVEFVMYCEEMIGDKHVFLYDLHYNVGMPTYYTLNPNTFDFAFLDTPIEFTKTGWKVRFAEL